MRHFLIPILAAALAWAAPASAMELHLSWGACGAAGVGDRVFTCDTNAGTDTLVASVRTATPTDLVLLAGLRAHLWIITGPGSAQFPDWWTLIAPGACRPAALTCEPTTVGDPGCPAYFLPSTGISVSFAPGVIDFDHAGIWDLRLIMDVVGPGRPPALAPAGVDVGLLRLIVRHDQTVGAGACGGCVQPMWISFVALELMDGVGSVVSTGATVTAASSVTWSPAAPTPARATTWGAIKSLYR